MCTVIHLFLGFALEADAFEPPAVDDAVETTLAAREVAFEVVLLPAADLTLSTFLFCKVASISFQLLTKNLYAINLL